MAGVIEGDEKVEFTETGARPDSLDVVVSPAPADTNLSEGDDNTSLMGNLVIQMSRYLSANPNIQATNFEVSKAVAYAPFLRFSKREGEGTLNFLTRKLTREEYISVLKQTSPELGLVLEKTDLKEVFPSDSLNVYRTCDYSPALAALGLRTEAGVEAIYNLFRCTQDFTYIPDLETFSLFLANGAQLRECLKTVGALYVGVQQSEPILSAERYTGQANHRILINFPELATLLSPSLILKYVEQTGKTTVWKMIEEYHQVSTEIARQIQLGNDSNTKIANTRKCLYNLLEKNNPDLVLG